MTVDWEDWQRTLARFAAATGLCVSAFDANGVRRVGPLHHGRVTALLAESGVWGTGEDGSGPGPGDRIEAELARRVIGTPPPQSPPQSPQPAPPQVDIADAMTVCGTPIRVGDTVCGAIVYGWVSATFGTPLGCRQLGRVLGVEPTRLWAAVRLTPPVPPARLAVFTALLQTMTASAARHAEAMERLSELGRVREVFLASVSHELRSPLSAIGLRIEALLRNGDLPAQVLGSLAKMKRHVAQQARLIDDLLDASRTRTGQLTLERQPVPLRAVLAESIATATPHAQAKGVRLDTTGLDDGGGGDDADDDARGGGDERRIVLADPHRLQQVLWNLLSNAVKFTPAGGRVTVSVSSDPRCVQVVVADTGQGIDPARLLAIFEPFQTSRAGNAEGLGLGLSIARHIVEAHGGTLRAESAGIGAGARFVMRLPRHAGTAQP